MQITEVIRKTNFALHHHAMRDCSNYHKTCKVLALHTKKCFITQNAITPNERQPSPLVLPPLHAKFQLSAADLKTVLKTDSRDKCACAGL